jgi:hypothetical protein
MAELVGQTEVIDDIILLLPAVIAVGAAKTLVASEIKAADDLKSIFQAILESKR